MKILGIVGSPRVGGNTEMLTRIALEEVSKEGVETELIRLAGKNIEPCNACGSCRSTGVCCIEDGFQEIYVKMVESDGFILASPVWFGGATPQMASLMSRCYLSRGGKNPFENKVGGPIVVGRRAGMNFTFAQLMFFFMIHGMIVPGSTYWNVAIGRGKGEVEKDEEGVRTIRNFGGKLAWLAKKVSM